MAKRFTDTGKWTNNKWFYELSPELKLFWIYILDNCDNVGVWEENIKLASIIIGYEYSMDTLLKAFDKQILVFKDNRKWWIKDFCYFQYGILEDNSPSKPIQSYIRLLKDHKLWILYTKGIDSPKEKDKEKDIDKDKNKEILLKSSEIWIEDICMKKGYIKQQVIDKLNTFIDDQELKGEMDRPINDIKGHFISWLNKQDMMQNKSYDDFLKENKLEDNKTSREKYNKHTEQRLKLFAK